MSAQNLDVECRPLPPLRCLSRQWRALEARAQAPVFLSWQWVGHWLAVYRPEGELLRVLDDNRVVGLGIVVTTSERRHGVLRSRCLRLHQTGYRELDQIWIEYNGFLAEQGYEAGVAKACLDFLCEQRSGWDEFVIGAVNALQARQFAQISGLHAHVRWQAPCFGVNLEQLRSGGRPYLETLTANTRYQINRAHRLYQQRGEVRLIRPESVEQALAIFDRIGPLHLARWGHGPDQSGYANPEFVRFHRALIADQWADGGVDLVSLMAGEQVIASFYNLLHRQTVYFYLGGMQTEQDNRLKPGLLGHSLCIEDYREQGFHFYDFMGGDERYKAQLGQYHSELVQVSLQRPRFKLQVEGAMRLARNRLLPEPGGSDREQRRLR